MIKKVVHPGHLGGYMVNQFGLGIIIIIDPLVWVYF